MYEKYIVKYIYIHTYIYIYITYIYIYIYITCTYTSVYVDKDYVFDIVFNNEGIKLMFPGNK